MVLEKGGGVPNLNVGAWESPAFAEDDEAFLPRNVAFHEVLRWGSAWVGGGESVWIGGAEDQADGFFFLGSSVPKLCRIGNEIKHE